MRALRPLFSLVLLLTLAGPALAQLYVGEVPTDEAGERPPVVEALNQVLVRVTGRVGADLAGELGLGAQQALSLSLARQFVDVEFPDDAGSTVRERHLRVDFDPTAIDRLLDEAGLPRWGRERPEMLLWIASDGPGGADYLEPDPRMQYALDDSEFRFGLPVTRPILDASDRIEVTPSDIRGGFAGVAEPARLRYGADGVILLDLREGPYFWTGRWVWRLGDIEQSFARSGATPSEVVELGLARIAGALAARFAVRPEAADLQRLVISGVERPVHYAEIRDYLAGLTGVQRLRLVAAEGDTLTFELQSMADGLQQRIELSGLLRFERNDLSTGTLYYALAL